MALTLLHGLRSVLGASLVDWPKYDSAYKSYPDPSTLYGHGFTAFALLDDVPVDRADAIERARDGEFDAVIFSDIWNQSPLFRTLRPQLGHTTVAAIDGNDSPALYPYHPKWWRRPAGWALPRAHTKAAYFKRELGPRTHSWRYFMALPPRLAGRLPLGGDVRPIAFSIPEEKIVAAPPPKSQLFASHVVDPEVARALGREGSGYVFDREADYYADLQASRYGITTKKAGWDCMRHYELAANGCVPCFRDLAGKPATSAPHGLGEHNCVPYRDYEDLQRRIAALDADGYESVQAGALSWARANSTRRRAEWLLSELELAAPEGEGLGAGGAARPEPAATDV
jgi:hypothetical protein